MKLLILILCCCSCITSKPKYIQGYIYSKENRPIFGLKVEDPASKNTFSISNKDGFFRINKMIDGKYLFILENNIKIDSIYIVRTHPERGVNYCFVDGRKDTVIIDMKLKKIIHQ